MTGLLIFDALLLVLFRIVLEEFILTTVREVLSELIVLVLLFDCFLILTIGVFIAGLDETIRDVLLRFIC